MRTYEEALAEVKALILPVLIQDQDPGEALNYKMSKPAYAEVLYSRVMALGYNGGDIQKALDDLMPTRNTFIYPGDNELEDKEMMFVDLEIALNDFKKPIAAFIAFHRKSQQGVSHEEVVAEVKSLLDADS